MGDVGAHFLGLCFGTLALAGGGLGLPIWVVVAVLGAFLYDSVYTLIRRLLRGENITLPHRFHLYQRLVALGWGHARVALAFGASTALLGTGAYLHQTGRTAMGGAIVWATGVIFIGATAWIETRWRAHGSET